MRDAPSWLVIASGVVAWATGPAAGFTFANLYPQHFILGMAIVSGLTVSAAVLAAIQRDSALASAAGFNPRRIGRALGRAYLLLVLVSLVGGMVLGVLFPHF